jgi:outer membrane protein
MLRPAALALALLALPAAAQPADTLRLDAAEALRLALADSPEVAIEQAGVAFARARARQARAARYLTTFGFTTGHALAPTLDVPEDTPYGRDALYLDPRVRNVWTDPRPYSQIDVELLQPIYTWGELSGQVRAADAAIGVERGEVQARASEVALRTGELYYGFLAAQELQALSDEAQRLLGSAREEVERLLDEGTPPSQIETSSSSGCSSRRRAPAP